MRNIDHLASCLAGFGIGVAASVLFAPRPGEKTRSRIRDLASRAGDVLKKRGEHLGDAAGDLLEEGKQTWRGGQQERNQSMNALKDKAKEMIDDTAEAAQTAAYEVVEKSKDVAHTAGKKMEEGGKRLQNA